MSLQGNIIPAKSLELLKTVSEIIDSIEIDGNNVLIKTSKNIIIHNQGNTLHISKGVNIQIADEIHLNPEVPVDDILQRKWKGNGNESKEISSS